MNYCYIHDGFISKIQDWSKKPSTEETYTVWFHLNSIWKQAKLIYGDRSKDRSYIWGEGKEQIVMGHDGAFRLG